MDFYQLPDDFELIPYIKSNGIDGLIIRLLNAYPSDDLYDDIENDIMNAHEGTIIDFMFKFGIACSYDCYYFLLMMFYATNKGTEKDFLYKFNSILTTADISSINSFVNSNINFRKELRELREANQDYEHRYIFDNYAISLIERFNSFLSSISANDIGLNKVHEIASRLDESYKEPVKKNFNELIENVPVDNYSVDLSKLNTNRSRRYAIDRQLMKVTGGGWTKSIVLKTYGDGRDIKIRFNNESNEFRLLYNTRIIFNGMFPRECMPRVINHPTTFKHAIFGIHCYRGSKPVNILLSIVTSFLSFGQLMECKTFKKYYEDISNSKIFGFLQSDNPDLNNYYYRILWEILDNYMVYLCDMLEFTKDFLRFAFIYDINESQTIGSIKNDINHIAGFQCYPPDLTLFTKLREDINAHEGIFYNPAMRQIFGRIDIFSATAPLPGNVKVGPIHSKNLIIRYAKTKNTMLMRIDDDDFHICKIPFLITCNFLKDFEQIGLFIDNPNIVELIKPMHLTALRTYLMRNEHYLDHIGTHYITLNGACTEIFEHGMNKEDYKQFLGFVSNCSNNKLRICYFKFNGGGDNMPCMTNYLNNDDSECLSKVSILEGYNVSVTRSYKKITAFSVKNAVFNSYFNKKRAASGKRMLQVAFDYTLSTLSKCLIHDEYYANQVPIASVMQSSHILSLANNRIATAGGLSPFISKVTEITPNDAKEIRRIEFFIILNTVLAKLTPARVNLAKILEKTHDKIYESEKTNKLKANLRSSAESIEQISILLNRSLNYKQDGSSLHDISQRLSEFADALNFGRSSIDAKQSSYKLVVNGIEKYISGIGTLNELIKRFSKSHYYREYRNENLFKLSITNIDSIVFILNLLLPIDGKSESNHRFAIEQGQFIIDHKLPISIYAYKNNGQFNCVYVTCSIKDFVDSLNIKSMYSGNIAIKYDDNTCFIPLGIERIPSTTGTVYTVAHKILNDHARSQSRRKQPGAGILKYTEETDRYNKIIYWILGVLLVITVIIAIVTIVNAFFTIRPNTADNAYF